MKQLKCIAVDDEPLALTLVCNFIQQTPFLELVGRYGTAIEALKGIHAREVDLLFMDIHMPDLSGMELAKIINQNKSATKPGIIFTTAYNDFALQGYKVDAIDYLLKPFDYDEFLQAAQKASMLAERNTSTATEPDHIFLKVEYRWVKVYLNTIRYIEGLKDYVKVYLTDGSYILSLNSLKSMEEKLPAKQFMRLNRSCIVSLPQITAITKTSVQINDMVVAVGENYKDAFARFIRDWIE